MFQGDGPFAHRQRTRQDAPLHRREAPLKHPRQNELALLAGGDLSMWSHWRVERHVARCGACQDQVRAFQAARARLCSERERLPEDRDWDSLAAEITGNIRVGLAAGACVGPVAAPRAARPRWHKAILAAPVALPLIAVLALAILYLRQRPQTEVAPWVEGTVVEATAGGIELRRGDRMLSLRQAGSGDVTYAVNAQGTVRASYVDSETGQVTIHNVYAQ